MRVFYDIQLTSSKLWSTWFIHQEIKWLYGVETPVMLKSDIVTENIISFRNKICT